jgi:hypothetical protein
MRAMCLLLLMDIHYGIFQEYLLSWDRISPHLQAKKKMTTQMGLTGQVTLDLRAQWVRWIPMLVFHFLSYNCRKITFYLSCTATFFFFFFYYYYYCYYYYYY